MDQGGSVYMEGADVAYSHHNNPFFAYFGTEFVHTGATEGVNILTGINGTVAGGTTFNYFGGSDAHYMIDELTADGGISILKSNDHKTRAISNITEVYRTICSSPIIGAFGNGQGLNLRGYLMGQYLDFFTGEFTSAENYDFPEITTALHGNFPNPFNPYTTINFYLHKDGLTNLEIYNIKGQKVKTLVNENLDKGQHSAFWNGKDNNNKQVSSGIYFYKLNTGNFSSTKKMILIEN